MVEEIQEEEKKADANLKQWLLNFARAAKSPVVISLLVEGEEIRFLQSSRKSIFGDGILGDVNIFDEDGNDEFSTLPRDAAKARNSAGIQYIG